ncbi:ribosome-associated toxin RatA of RatAB toxin-antitoxin module [Sinobacterium caligoides]|uniref:Ribosome-associated toxin RatA of RatAB toxin-antitoxin module n=1 Tax=Sinobacterium caligoides TaxID=933926 RepID=A0A3N2DFT6_9GAMM|nr:type II toxin-antitoxin system RatA family toxin [Sinobacterium caligoides]ROR98663.1 ribosome-associated toxin RatA of RatAB toxin-antitoxin module [Sinobacterium caligoides]
MVEINRSALLPYSAARLFSMVNDVAAYPEYMEGCVGTEVFEASAEHMKARLDLAKGPLKYSIVTENTLHQDASIVMTLVEGPLQDFEGLWTFTALGEEACKVSLDIRFNLSSRLLGGAAAKLFGSLGATLVDSLSQRAHQLYGK